MDPRIHRIVSIIPALSLLLIAPALLAAKPPPQPPEDKPPISIDVEGFSKYTVPIEPASGWPLTFELKANPYKLLGVATSINAGSVDLPTAGRLGFLVFDDPDTCPSYVAGQFLPGGAFGPQTGTFCDQLPSWPHDELLLQFRSGVTVAANIPDDPDPETDDAVLGFRTCFPSQTGCVEGNNKLFPLYPQRGNNTDGFSFGASERVPGFVLVADRGPSIRTNQEFNKSSPLQCRNLAGLANTVGHTFRDNKGITSVTVQFNVANLFKPVILGDGKVSNDCNADGGSSADVLYRIDGGPVRCLGTTQAFEDLIANEFRHVVTARAFVVNIDDNVNNNVPDVITDLNGNGFCDAGDAQMAGYRMLSDEKVIQFVEWHQEVVWIPYDFDGNGEAGAPVAPAGSGGLRAVPQ